MDTIKAKKLQTIGVDIEKGVSRFMGNAEMYARFIEKFPSEPTYSQLQSAIDNCDWEKALSAAHTLKGVAGNLGMNRLFTACSDVVGHLRNGEQKEAMQSYETLKAAYLDIIHILKPR